MPRWPGSTAVDMEERSLSEREAIARIYEKYGPLVLRRCRYLLRDEEAAKDASHEVFVKIMRARSTFRGEASPMTWILKIATNHCLNVIASKNAPWRERYREYAKHARDQVVFMGEDREKSETVLELLSRVDRETQEIVIHYFVDEMTQAEIAELVHRSLPTVRKRIQKFLRVARKELGHELE